MQFGPSLNEVPGWLNSTAAPAGDPRAASKPKEESRLMDLDSSTGTRHQSQEGGGEKF